MIDRPFFHIRLIALATVLLCLDATVGITQDLPIEPIIQRDVSPDASLFYTMKVNSGDVVSGTIELLRGAPTGIRIFDPAGIKLKEFVVYDSGTSRATATVGFAAPADGAYRVEISCAGAKPDDPATGSFSLRLETKAPAVRMMDVHAEPAVHYASPRMVALSKALQTGQADAAPRFWAELDGKIPFVEAIAGDDRNVLVTFLWKETYETHNVVVLWPPALFGSENDYYMTHLPGSNVWYKTVRVARASRFTYQLSPNHRREEREVTSQPDPLNKQRDIKQIDLSLLELPGAPDDSWSMRIPSIKGDVTQRKFESPLLKGSRPVSIYTPPGYNASRGPYPLLVIFDGVAYLSGFKAATILDNLIGDRRIRPPIVCFLTSTNASDPKSPVTRPQDMNSAWQPFADAVATELVPWLRSMYAISANPKDVTVGGYSAGGRGAALVALRHSEVFGNVLSQSGTFAGPLLTSSGNTEGNILSRMYIEAAKLSLKFYIDVGLYEQNHGDLPVDEMALTEGMTIGNRHFRDVLEAKGYEVIYREMGGEHAGSHFRATFAEALIALLPTGGL